MVGTLIRLNWRQARNAITLYRQERGLPSHMFLVVALILTLVNALFAAVGVATWDPALRTTAVTLGFVGVTVVVSLVALNPGPGRHDRDSWLRLLPASDRRRAVATVLALALHPAVVVTTLAVAVLLMVAVAPSSPIAVITILVVPIQACFLVVTAYCAQILGDGLARQSFAELRKVFAGLTVLIAIGGATMAFIIWGTPTMLLLPPLALAEATAAANQGELAQAVGLLVVATVFTGIALEAGVRLDRRAQGHHRSRRSTPVHAPHLRATLHLRANPPSNPPSSQVLSLFPSRLRGVGADSVGAHLALRWHQFGPWRAAGAVAACLVVGVWGGLVVRNRLPGSADMTWFALTTPFLAGSSTAQWWPTNTVRWPLDVVPTPASTALWATVRFDAMAMIIGMLITVVTAGGVSGQPVAFLWTLAVAPAVYTTLVAGSCWVGRLPRISNAYSRPLAETLELLALVAVGTVVPLAIGALPIFAMPHFTGVALAVLCVGTGVVGTTLGLAEIRRVGRRIDARPYEFAGLDVPDHLRARWARQQA